MFYRYKNILINLNQCSEILQGTVWIRFYSGSDKEEIDLITYETEEECQKEWKKILKLVGK